MINIKRTEKVPASLQTEEIQKYLDHLVLCKENPDLPKQEPPESYRNSDVLKAIEDCFYSKCYLTEQHFVTAWVMDIDHFIPKNENQELRYAWTNLYPADHNANMARPRKTPVGGFLDPCSPLDDVEKEILYHLPIGGDNPKFEASNKDNLKAVNTASLLDVLHNGKDSNSVEKVKQLKFLIRKKHNEVLYKIIEWKDAKEKNDQTGEFIKRSELRALLSRKSSFTMLLRSMDAVRTYVPRELLD